jgi:sugar (pentulose or hexulose) kinase
VLIINERGRVISSATEDHRAFVSPQIGWAEQDPCDWWRACGVAVHLALAQAQLRSDQISCVGLSGQMHGTVLFDEQERVIRPALIWCDGRTEKQCRDLTTEIGADPTDRPALDSRGRLHTFCHSIPGRWIAMGVTQAAGLSLRWFRDQFGWATRVGSYEALTAEAAGAPPGCDGLLWAPYLMGERTPYLDPAARGMLFGLTASHIRGHVIRAILEGLPPASATPSLFLKRWKCQ